MGQDIEVLDAERSPITFDQLRLMMGWSWGDTGTATADYWHRINQDFFDGALQPCPIWFPAAVPYGRWIGLFTCNKQQESLHIQIAFNQTHSLAAIADVLLHEMVHQRLSEAGRDTRHNAAPWCNEIMRLTREIWEEEIWCSPSLPVKNAQGRSRRVQKPSPEGRESLSRKAISTWPHSLNLSIADYYSELKVVSS